MAKEWLGVNINERLGFNILLTAQPRRNGSIKSRIGSQVN